MNKISKGFTRFMSNLTGKRQRGVPIKFVGWIYGNKDDEKFLRANGVYGEMRFKRKDNTKSITSGAHNKKGVFEHCIIDNIEIAKKLYEIYPAFWAGSFTGMREDGVQTIDQPLWKMGQFDKDHKNTKGIIVSNYTFQG